MQECTELVRDHKWASKNVTREWEMIDRVVAKKSAESHNYYASVRMHKRGAVELR